MKINSCVIYDIIEELSVGAGALAIGGGPIGRRVYRKEEGLIILNLSGINGQSKIYREMLAY